MCFTLIGPLDMMMMEMKMEENCNMLIMACRTDEGSDKNTKNSGHLRLCQQPRAVHALRLDQLPKIVAIFICASSHWQRTHSALTKRHPLLSTRIPKQTSKLECTRYQFSKTFKERNVLARMVICLPDTRGIGYRGSCF